LIVALAIDFGITDSIKTKWNFPIYVGVKPVGIE
jgi:hypothetical protein